MKTLIRNNVQNPTRMNNDPLKLTGMHNHASPIVFKNAAKLRSTMTVAELRLWKYLKTKPEGFKFRRQHPIGCYVLDFYCHKLRLSIELDGAYHLSHSQKLKDAERTSYLTELGIVELRFSNEVIINELESWIEDFCEKLREGAPFMVNYSL